MRPSLRSTMIDASRAPQAPKNARDVPISTKSCRFRAEVTGKSAFACAPSCLTGPITRNLALGAISSRYDRYTRYKDVPHHLPTYPELLFESLWAAYLPIQRPKRM